MNLDNANYAIPVLQQEPENKHKVLRALLSILLFVIVAGFLVIYQINKKPVVSTEVTPTVKVVQKSNISAEELKWLADALKKDSVNKSPPTAKELTAMANALNKDAKSQKQLSAEELQDLAKNLNQK
jgi:uncharacterized protein YfkK (UPF0435 family)